MSALHFTVIGDPKPKGSYRAYTYRRRPERGGGIGARVDNDNPGTSAWQEAVGWAAARAMRDARVRRDGGAIAIAVQFHLSRPKCRRRYDGPHVTKPDLDKLQRALLDGLKGVVYGDDAQVVRIESGKQYADGAETPRAVVTITPVDMRGLFQARRRRRALRSGRGKDGDGDEGANQAAARPRRPDAAGDPPAVPGSAVRTADDRAGPARDAGGGTRRAAARRLDPVSVIQIYADSKNLGTCRSCDGRVIEDVDTTITTSHFATCPDADRWRRRQ